MFTPVSVTRCDRLPLQTLIEEVVMHVLFPPPWPETPYVPLPAAMHSSKFQHFLDALEVKNLGGEAFAVLIAHHTTTSASSLKTHRTIR